MKNNRLKIVSLLSILFLAGSMVITSDALAKKKKKKKKEKKEAVQEEQVTPAAQPAADPAPGGIKAFQGEITDEMISSFLVADSKIRMLRQKIARQTQTILETENVKPEVYVAIIQRSREDANFLERVRERAAELAAEVPEAS